MADGITNPRIDEVYYEARRAGTLGGKISGAGGGGFMFFFCDPRRRFAVQSCLLQLNAQLVNFSFVKEGVRDMDGFLIDRTSEATVISVLDEHITLVAGLRRLVPTIREAAALVAASLAGGGKVLLCGNGGSAADAQHVAGELVGRFLKERRPLPALALHANTSVLSAIGNDYGFEEIFARQVAAHGCEGDVLVAISTSGNSPNILRAAVAASGSGLKVIGMTGEGGGELKELCDLCLCVPSGSTPRIQEMHILIGHIIAQLVEEALC